MAKDKQNPELAPEIIGAIASDLLPTIPAPEVASRIKDKLLSRIKAAEGNHRFVLANQGDWQTIAQGVQVKVLRQVESSRSLLIKMAANSVLPAHPHAFDEEAIVLEGEVWLEGVLCRMGDYHLAHAGSAHQAIHTQQGCLLFIRNA